MSREADERMADAMRRADWIQTYTGRQVFPGEPDARVVCIEDIAHSLALQARFAGHTASPYSVAQHSVLVAGHVAGVARRIPDMPMSDFGRLVLVALLHDAAEAYVQDLVRPVKRFAGFAAGYVELERGWALAIGEAFGLGVDLVDLPEVVTVADNVLLATEARDLFATMTPAPWGPLPEPRVERIEPWWWEKAEMRFLEHFHELTALGSSFGEDAS